MALRISPDPVARLPDDRRRHRVAEGRQDREDAAEESGDRVEHGGNLRLISGFASQATGLTCHVIESDRVGWPPRCT
jgi:hypothetical protein